MKHLNEIINEGIFNIDKDLTPFEIARALKDYQYNTTDGGKDCFGQPLSRGDLILIFSEVNNSYGLRIGVYTQKKGRFCQFWLSNPDLSETEEESIQYLGQAYCSKVFKLNKKDINI